MLGLWSHFRAEMLTSSEVTAVPDLVQSVTAQKVPEKQCFVYFKYFEVPLLIRES